MRGHFMFIACSAGRCDATMNPSSQSAMALGVISPSALQAVEPELSRACPPPHHREQQLALFAQRSRFRQECKLSGERCTRTPPTCRSSHPTSSRTNHHQHCRSIHGMHAAIAACDTTKHSSSFKHHELMIKFEGSRDRSRGRSSCRRPGSAFARDHSSRARRLRLAIAIGHGHEEVRERISIWKCMRR